MALWAKVDVDTPTDCKLLGQPVATRLLWLCLICLAKQQDDHGAIRGYDCGLLSGRFNVPRGAVAKALTHYQLQRMVELDPDGTIRLLNFDRRQGADDTANERQRRYYDSHREEILEKKKSSRLSSREGSSLEQNRAEIEKEEKQKNDRPVAIAPVPALVVETPITELEKDWDLALLHRVHEALASTRKSGGMAEGPWRGFLLSARQFTREIRARAAAEYLDRACAAEGKAEAYLIGIMRGETKRAQQPSLAARPGAAQLRVDNEEHNRNAIGKVML